MRHPADGCGSESSVPRTVGFPAHDREAIADLPDVYCLEGRFFKRFSVTVQTYTNSDLSRGDKSEFKVLGYRF